VWADAAPIFGGHWPRPMKTRLTGGSTKTRTNGLAPAKANLPEVWVLQPMQDSN